MTVKELQVFFREHMVPSKWYKLDGKQNNRICLTRGEEGWEVYFSEKKEKIGLSCYKDETSACQAMKNEIRKMMETMYGLTWAAE